MPRLRDYSLRSGFKAFSLILLLQASAQVASAAECIALNRVDIVAAELVGESGLTMLPRPFLGQCIDSNLIRTILSEISNDLIARGYVTSRPYLLEQDISDGQIEVQILVGTIEAIIDADSGVTNGQITTAFMFNDEILNLRQLETSLEAIERARSVSANFEIRPGTKQGGSIVAIKTLETNPFHTELGVNARTDLDPQLSFQAVLAKQSQPRTELVLPAG
jgi:hemolysin activation/secretion protein